MWASPLKPKKEKKDSTKQTVKPTMDKEKELEKFKPIKLVLPKAEAKKILDRKKDLAYQQIEWVQNWLENYLRERSYPPQFAGADAYSQIMLFLNPKDSLELLSRIRAEFSKTLPPDDTQSDEYDFLKGLDLGDYHKHLPDPTVADGNPLLV